MDVDIPTTAYYFMCRWLPRLDPSFPGLQRYRFSDKFEFSILCPQLDRSVSETFISFPMYNNMVPAHKSFRPTAGSTFDNRPVFEMIYIKTDFFLQTRISCIVAVTFLYILLLLFITTHFENDNK